MLEGHLQVRRDAFVFTLRVINSNVTTNISGVELQDIQQMVTTGERFVAESRALLRHSMWNYRIEGPKANVKLMRHFKCKVFTCRMRYSTRIIVK